MRSPLKTIRLIASGLMLIILCGCKTYISGLKVDPAFTYQSAVSGHIAIVGIVSSVAPLAAADIATYSNQINTQLNDKRPDFVLISYGEVVNQLGPENHAKLLNDIQTIGTPSTSSLDVLRTPARGYRYILFSRIESDLINKFTMSEETPIKGIRPITSRNVTASLQVVDITDGKIVWSASAATMLQNATGVVPIPKKTRLSEKILNDAVDSILGGTSAKPEDFHYPPEPSLTNVLQELFRGLAKHMPDK